MGETVVPSTEMIGDRAIDEIRLFEPMLRRMGTQAAFLFGSTARGDRREDSDIDVLLDIPRGTRFTLLDLAHVQRLLSDGLQAPVDLTIRADLSAGVAERVVRDAIRIF